MTLRALARGSLLYTLANLIPRLGTFLLLPLLTRLLGRAEFGIVSLAGSGALLVAIALRLGLDASLLRFHADLAPPDRAALYATVAAISAGAAALLVALAAVLAPLLMPAAAGFAILAVVTGALSAFQFLPSVWYRATGQPGRFLAMALGAFAVYAMATVALVAWARLGAVGAIVAQLLGAAVFALAAVVLLGRMRPPRPRRELAARTLRFGLPLVAHGLLGWILNVSDRWLLAAFLGLAAAPTLAAIGVYSLGYQLGYAIALVAISFHAAWLPLFYRLGAGSQGPGLLRAVVSVTVAGYAMLATVLGALAPEIVGIVAPAEWREAADVAAVVGFASVLNAASLVLASPLYLVGSTAVVPILTLVAGTLNVALNALLIPRIGIMGAAWATLAAYAALSGLTWALARGRYELRLDAGRLAALAAVAVIAVLVARAAPAGSLAVPWHALAAAAGCVGLALLARRPLLEARTAMATDSRGRDEGSGSVG